MNYFKLFLTLAASGLFVALAVKFSSAKSEEKPKVARDDAKSYSPQYEIRRVDSSQQPQKSAIYRGAVEKPSVKSTQSVSSGNIREVEKVRPVIEQKKEGNLAKVYPAPKPAKIEESFYDILIENITQRLDFHIQDNRTLEKRVVKLDGEELFKKVKADFAYMLDSQIAKEAFRGYFLHYYQKNKNLSKVYRDAKIDLMNLDNFVKFSTLREAFLFYREQERVKESL
ncbi:MAG: hypothetical protein PHO62_07805 [Sulfurimonas sp.]|uniref:hypothetical protein n=1 Tax=Sulfurimonas sp. TaxID=2022749 RepID=UPI00260400F1|nr:hypothetical protein [Sulfurimonas sp.]MDD5373311.1 hypothetical protein [Sulfurimonas sp.]